YFHTKSFLTPRQNAIRSKPGLCPESHVLPIIISRQRENSPRGGVLAIDPRDTGVVVWKTVNGFWGRCPGCNPPSVLSSICLIGEPAPPAEDHRRLLPLSHRCRDPFHPQPASSTFPGRGRIIVIYRPGKVSFLRPCSGSHLAPLTATTVSAMWVEFPQDHDHGPVTAHRLAAYPNDYSDVRCRGLLN